MLQPDDFPSGAGSEPEQNDAPPRNVFHEGFQAILRSVLAGIGILLIPIGVIVAMLTPVLPVGLPIIIFGVVLVARNFPAGKRVFRRILHRFPTLEKFAPDWLLKLIFGEGGDTSTMDNQEQKSNV